MYDDGGQTRCFAHAREVVESVITLVDTDAVVEGVFNIGSGEAVTIRKPGRGVISRVDSKVKIDYLPYCCAYGDDFEDVRRRVPDVTRLYDTIGTKPVMTLGAILDDIIRWKRAERDRTQEPRTK